MAEYKEVFTNRHECAADNGRVFPIEDAAGNRVWLAGPRALQWPINLDSPHSCEIIVSHCPFCGVKL